MIGPASPALTTVRGFQGTPVTSGEEDSDYGATPTPPLRGREAPRRGRQKRMIIDDVVSANCSPVLKPAASPAIGGIAKLRMHLEPLSLSLDSAVPSRASSMSRSDSRQKNNTPLAAATNTGGGGRDGASSERAGSSHGSGDETTVSDATSYEINLENDFVSDSVRGRGAGVMFADAIEGGL